MIHKRFNFVIWFASKIDVNSKWQLQLMKCLYYIVKWINETECKNEGHWRVKFDKCDFVGYCGRCNELIIREDFTYEPTPVNIAFSSIIEYGVVKPSYVSSISLMCS